MQTSVVSEGKANSLPSKSSVSKADLAAPKTTIAISEQHGMVRLAGYSRVFIRIRGHCRSDGNCHPAFLSNRPAISAVTSRSTVSSAP
jgi:hypothetical protein